ncbi:tRNA pseudouridine(13) synthase TruD [Candidatus Woesearchaeota archaeon]|nr:tRNA pseudouridine(13) synthase TruD [Candidatus Woesearchaeota archaeon]MCF8013004.1 tRNA pseudouridine(13) synthase TruD [Candidatus Woesearchaeota archaeon]
MYTLKQIPEDFQVTEIPEKEFLKEGTYQVWKLTKTNYNTEDAIKQISKALHIERKTISYAGTKDRNAITKQYITIKNTQKEKIEKIELKDIQLEFCGYLNQPLSLGDLKGNKFKITIRNLNNEQIAKIKTQDTEHKKQNTELIPNYFDEQRFQKNNAEIGKLLVKKKFKEAYNLLKEDYQYGKIIKEHFEENQNDYINALRKIPKKILKLYVHAYQSKLWNETTTKILHLELATNIPENIPIIGFGTEKTENEKIQEIIEEIMKKEEITEREFINQQIPELTVEGTKRKTYIKLQNLKINKPEKDELNQDKEKINIEFSIGKGSYATIVIKHIFGPKNN